MADLVTSGAYLARTDNLLWNLSGTRRASKNGRRGRRISSVAGRRSKGEISVRDIIYLKQDPNQGRATANG